MDGIFLERKKAALAEILRLTKGADLTLLDEGENEYRRVSEAYVTLHEKRAALFEEINDADECAGGEILDGEIKDYAGQILALDTANREIAAKMAAFLKKNVQEMNMAKLARKYVGDE